MRQSSILDGSPSGKSPLESGFSFQHSGRLFCKYLNNTQSSHNTHSSPEVRRTSTTILERAEKSSKRKRKRKIGENNEEFESLRKSSSSIKSMNPKNAFLNIDLTSPSGTSNRSWKTGNICMFTLLFGLALILCPVDAQSNETDHSLVVDVPNGTTLSNTRLSVLKFETNRSNTTQKQPQQQQSSQHYRPLHFRSYHFAKVLLFPVKSSSDLNHTFAQPKLSLPGHYSSKHSSIKRKRSGRYRRLTPASGSGGPSGNSALHSYHSIESYHPKSKSGSGPIPGLGPLPSSSLPGQNRLKILTSADLASQSPFGPVVPDSKCNYELYPSGCFDENGSVCDSSARRCVCRPGHSIQLEGLYCLRPATIGEACYTTEQCERRVANSGCFNYREEYRLEHPSAFFGPAQSSWPMGECRCRAGYRHDSSLGACTPALIGAWCSNAWDCQDPNWLDSSSHGHHSNKGGHSSVYHHGGSHNRTSSIHHSGSGGSSSGSHRKAPNVVCDGNVCACASFFHFNDSVSECQYRETFGRTCKAHDSSITSSSSSDSSSSSEKNNEIPIKCNPPSICSINGTCVCPDNFEHQPNSKPQCQRFKGQSSAILFGNSNRSGFFDFDKGSSGLSIFAEYCLYILIPALLIIFGVWPLFRRIGKWRNHVHQYSSDTDIFQGFTRPVMSAAEMNALQTAAEKGISSTAAATFTFDPCHAPYLFDSAALVDSCFGFTPVPQTSGYHHRPSLGPNDPSLAAVREKLQTIEESQSESGAENGLASATGSVCRCGSLAGVPNCCETAQLGVDPGTVNVTASQESAPTTTPTPSNPVDDVIITNSSTTDTNATMMLSQQPPQESTVDSL